VGGSFGRGRRAGRRGDPGAYDFEPSFLSIHTLGPTVWWSSRQRSVSTGGVEKGRWTPATKGFCDLLERRHSHPCDGVRLDRPHGIAVVEDAGPGSGATGRMSAGPGPGADVGV